MKNGNVRRIKRNPNDIVKMKVRDVEKIKQKAIMDALEVLVIFPLLALRDSEGFGKKRLLRFKEKFDGLLVAYDDGEVSLEDVRQVLIDEVGIKITRSD